MKDLLLLTKSVWTRYNELRLNIDTSQPVRRTDSTADPHRKHWLGDLSNKAKYRDNYEYASPDYWYLSKVIKRLSLAAADVVYDLGAGKGRFLCVAAQKPVRRCIGIELVDSLCASARQNAAQMRGRRAEVKVVCDDAAKADISDGTVYFLFNPFGADTLRDTLANIERSMLRAPRKVTIVYYNPVHASILEECEWLRKLSEFQTHGGLRVTFWGANANGFSVPHNARTKTAR